MNLLLLQLMKLKSLKENLFYEVLKAVLRDSLVFLSAQIVTDYENLLIILSLETTLTSRKMKIPISN